ncbi:hypothetical protein FACS1894188_09910 [Clostridia bacterium]|nr:hypothetical protein FACS1894188_09910 [Clostridia bacterium]
MTFWFTRRSAADVAPVGWRNKNSNPNNYKERVRMEKTMPKITALANNCGFIYRDSEIYGGVASLIGFRAAWRSLD